MTTRFPVICRSLAGQLRSLGRRKGKRTTSGPGAGSSSVTAMPGELSGRRRSAWEELDKISFHFFNEFELLAIRHRLKEIAVTNETLTMRTIPKGTIATPFLKNGKCTSGVFDERCKLLDESVRVGGSTLGIPVEPNKQELCDAVFDSRTAAYFGFASTHYGHFLLETLPRAWAWFQIDQEVVPILLVRERIPTFARGFFEILPDFFQRVMIPERMTRFQEVLLPASAFVIRQKANVQYKTFCIQIADRVLPSGEPSTSQPVYLSRSGLKLGTHRAIVGEDRLERLLEKEGFLIVHPERLSIPEQIATVNRHSWIVAPKGSACHTRLFARTPTNLVMFARPDFSANYVLCDSLDQGSTHYADVFTIPDFGYSNPAPWQPALLDEDRLLGLLKQLGLIRPKAAFDGPPPDAESYKTNWLAVAKWAAAKSPSEELECIIRNLS